MASNTHTLADEDGSFEDWIEIQNNSPANVNLLDWSLTDNPNNLTKWRFPSTNLPPGGFLVVFASNKDRDTAGAQLHTNFKLDAQGEYLALVDPTGRNIVSEFAPQFPPQVPDVSFGFALTASNETLVTIGTVAQVLVPSVANGGSTLYGSWTGNATNEPFNTAGWSNGVTGIGFNAGAPGEIGLNVQSAMLNQNASVFVRIPFVANDPSGFSLLTLRIKYDDGFVAWVNGHELARADAPFEDLDWNSTAPRTHAASMFESLPFGIATNLLRSGTNILAIQGLNVAADDSSCLILPELIGTRVAGENAGGLYFTQPTPGAENLGGTIVPGPGIADVKHTPNVPLENDNLVVTARVFPTAHPVAGVVLHYRVMFDPETSLVMYDDGAHGDGAVGDGVYGASIPAAASTTGQMVRYYITAADSDNTISRLPVFSDPAATAEYFGTVVNPGYVTSALPVIHLFAPPSVLQPGPTTSQTGADSQGGGRISLFYDGEFYDNVEMNLRGNTTAGFNKKSHRLNFNKEHPFRYSDSAKRIRHTSFEADYPDPTYMRQGLSFWLGTLAGVPSPFCSPVRLQLNGAFYELATHSDVAGKEMLERLGFDPNGAYYANVGTAVPGGYSTGGFEKKTRLNEDNSDYNELINAIAPSRPLGERMTNLFDRFALPEAIDYVVVARFTHQNDDVWAGMALYHDNDGDDLWRVMPYDENLSWGAAFMDASVFQGIQVTNDNLKSFPLYGSSQAVAAQGGSAFNGVYDALFQVPQTREMILRHMRTFLDTYIKPPGTPAGVSPVEQKIIAWRNLIGHDAQRDRAWWGWPPLGGQCNFQPGIDLTNGVNILLNDFLDKRRAHFYGKHCITNTALPIGISKYDNAGIPLSQPANAVVSITGFDFNPTSGNQDEEYVRLSNANPYAVDISGWKLSGGIGFTFYPGTVIPSGSALYVSPNTRAFRNRAISPHGGQGLFVVGPYEGHLNAWGESLTLTDDGGRLVSSNSFVGAPSPAQRYLRITEIMYNPSPLLSVTDDAQQFEYIELKNISTNVALNLDGVRFTNGIHFDFTDSAVTSLGPQQTVLLVRNQAAFTARYGSGHSIAGQYTGALDNGGETLRLEDAAGEKILEFAYNDSWYPITDGLGFSLVIVDENAPWDTWDRKSSWRPSGNLNGSQGATDPLPPNFGRIVINEALTHTDLPELDSIELFNAGTNSVDLGGWFLTDDFFTPRKYRIPNGTTLGAGSYLVFNENQFNQGLNAFRLSELGESVYLFSGGADTNLTGYSQGYDFPAAPNGVSFGRYTNSQGDVHFVLQSAVTLGAPNAYPRVGPIVISEIMYHPPDIDGADNDLDEFIELQNIAATNVPLYDPAYPTNSWRLRHAVDFNFPLNQVLAAGGRLLVVGFDPANTAQRDAFRAKYDLPTGVPIYGPWSGKLDNSSETIELKQPGAPDDTLVVPYYMIDKVSYEDQAPWPAGADGIGNSLQRVSNTGYGNDPTNWFAAGVTAGRASVPDLPPTVSITSPTNGEAVIATNGLIISVVAGDGDGSLSLVQLFADGAELARWSSTTTSDYYWSSPSVGLHSLKARATDNLGAVTESPPVVVSVLVGAPPTVDWLAPTNASILTGGSTVVLAANARSGGGTAQSVTYYLDGSLIGGAAAPFELAWTANPPGDHMLSVVALDAEAQVSAPDTVSVFVQAASVDPVLIPPGSNWKYLDDGSNQGTNWIGQAYNDSAWKSGPAQLGYGDGDEATVISYGSNYYDKYITYYFRKQFVVPSLDGISDASLGVLRDDGAIAYVNGREVFRSNMTNGLVNYLTRALSQVTGPDESTRFYYTNFNPSLLVPGTNTLAIEVHQGAPNSSDVSFDARLSLSGEYLGPAIAEQPISQTVNQGGEAAFTVEGRGTAPLSYRWYSGQAILASTSFSLQLTNVQTADAGSYYAVVTNFFGSVTSSIVTLTIVGLDTDGDGLPDAWEQANGTDPLIPDAYQDADHDGMNNFQEYLAGTSPTNAASVLKIESTGLSDRNVIFSFYAVSNHDYTVQFTPDLASATWQKLQDFAVAPDNRQYWVTNGMGAGNNRFYRVVTPRQP